MSKFYMTIPQSQTNSKINPLILGIMDEYNSTRLGAMDILLTKAWNHRLVFVSQTYLAKALGVERETINRTVKWLREHEWIRTKRRYDDTLLYFVNPEVIKHREILKWKLPALRFVLCVSMLWNVVSQANVTSNILMNKLYKDQSIPLIINQSIFLKNQSSTSSHERYLTKEKVMSAERPIINQIKDQFRIPEDQMSFFKKHSDIVLQNAILKYDEAVKNKDIKHPIGYFRTVVGTAQEKHERKAEKGRMGTFAKKIVNVSTNNNHSPSKEAQKTSKDERISFILREIANYEKQLAERREWLKNVPGGEYLITMAENAIVNYKRELSELHYSPDDVQCEAPRYFEHDPQAAEYRVGDRDYEEHLDRISADKSDPIGYKELVRRTDYRRMARK